jgi:PBSX family phage terminase large subunit
MDLKVSETFNRTAEVFYPGKYRQIVSMGGSRSSKTYSILQILMLELMSKKRIKITVWRDTKVTCRSTVMEDFKKIIMFDEKVFLDFKENKQTGKFTYKPTGSEIIFEGADSIGKVLGGAQDISYFNEVTEFSKEVYLQITQRTADKVLCDYNPHKDFWLEKYRNDPDTVFIHSDFTHNAFCPPNIIKQLKSYEPWETGSYEVIESDVYYKGSIISSINQPPKHKLNTERGTASVYHWLVYGLGLGSEKPNRIYTGWKKVTLEHFESLDYTSYFGLDFGTSNPTACVEVKYDGDGGFYICPRFYKPLTNISESLPTIIDTKVKNIVKGKSLIVADPAKESYINILREAGHLIIKALKGAGSVGSGITVVQGFTIYYVYDPDIDDEYNNYSWHVDRYNKSTDEPVKADDHYMDALRYIINYLVKYLGIKL